MPAVIINQTKEEKLRRVTRSWIDAIPLYWIQLHRDSLTRARFNSKTTLHFLISHNSLCFNIFIENTRFAIVCWKLKWNEIASKIKTKMTTSEPQSYKYTTRSMITDLMQQQRWKTQDGRMTKKCRARLCIPRFLRDIFSSICRPESSSRLVAVGLSWQHGQKAQWQTKTTKEKGKGYVENIIVPHIW